MAVPNQHANSRVSEWEHSQSSASTFPSKREKFSVQKSAHWTVPCFDQVNSLSDLAALLTQVSKNPIAASISGEVFNEMLACVFGIDLSSGKSGILVHRRFSSVYIDSSIIRSSNWSGE